MDPMKIRLKVGGHEFEAEGPPEVVQAQLEVWKGLVAQAAVPRGASPAGGNTAPPSTDQGGGAPLNGAGDDGVRRLFALDDRRDLVTLRAHPQGESREADAVLLIVFGYRLLREEDEVLVTKLLQSIKVSGFSVERIDRVVGPHLTAGYLLKTGRAKGGKYRLTNTGLEQARRLATSLVGAMA